MSYVPGDIALLPDGTDAALPASEVEVLRQRIHNWFSIRLGSYQYDTSAGFNPGFVQAPGSRRSREALLRSEIRRGILGQPGVRAVGPIQLRALPRRGVRASAEVVTDFGPLSVEVGLPT